MTACGFQNFCARVAEIGEEVVRSLLDQCYLGYCPRNSRIARFFRRNSNFKIAVVIDICHRAPVFLRPTFISCNTYCYVFSNGRILQEQVSSRPRLSFRHESCGAGYFACPPVARTSCSLCGRRTLSAGIYIASLLWIDSTVFSVAAMRS